MNKNQTAYNFSTLSVRKITVKGLALYLGKYNQRKRTLFVVKSHKAICLFSLDRYII